ncbi:cache domain-containing protein [Methylobacterium persicinum]
MLAILGISVASVLVIGIVSIQEQRSASENAIGAALMQRYSVVSEAMADQGLRALAVAHALANDRGVAQAMAERDRPAILGRMEALYPNLKALDLSLITFSGPDGHIIARPHAPERFGDDVRPRRAMIRDVVANHRSQVGIEPGADSITIFATVPTLESGRYVGNTDVGAILGREFLATLKKRTNTDIAMHLLGEKGLTTLGATFAEQTLFPRRHIRPPSLGRYRCKCSTSTATPSPPWWARCGIIPARPSARWRWSSTSPICSPPGTGRSFFSVVSCWPSPCWPSGPPWRFPGISAGRSLG